MFRPQRCTSDMVFGWPLDQNVFIKKYLMICRHRKKVKMKNPESDLGSEFLICFEAWAKMAQKWLVCAPLRIYLEPINKELMLLVTI